MRRVERATLPDISIRQLEYLLAVEDARTWSEAAASVGVSASALSQGLAELERRIGVRLFQPEGRRRVLRSTAQPILQHARQVVALTGDLAAWSERVRTSRAGRVRLGLIDVAAVVHFPDVVRSFRLDRPNVDFTFSVAPSAALLDDLRVGSLDLVVCVEPPDAIPGVDVSHLLSEPLYVFAPAGTSFGSPPSWGPWVLFPLGSHTRAATVTALHDRGAHLRIAAEAHQADVLMEMIGLGLGWTVLPRPAVLPGHVAVGPMLLERRLVLARRSETVHDPVAAELAQRLTSHSDRSART